MEGERRTAVVRSSMRQAVAPPEWLRRAPICARRHVVETGISVLEKRFCSVDSLLHHSSEQHNWRDKDGTTRSNTPRVFGVDTRTCWLSRQLCAPLSKAGSRIQRNMAVFLWCQGICRAAGSSSRREVAQCGICRSTQGRSASSCSRAI